MKLNIRNVRTKEREAEIKENATKIEIENASILFTVGGFFLLVFFYLLGRIYGFLGLFFPTLGILTISAIAHCYRVKYKAFHLLLFGVALLLVGVISYWLWTTEHIYLTGLFSVFVSTLVISFVTFMYRLESRILRIKGIEDGNIRLLKSATKTDLFLLTPRDFERSVKMILEGNGYTNVELTSYTADYGVDLLAEKDGSMFIVECKKWEEKHKVGRREIMILDSARRHAGGEGIFIATSSFTKPAEEHAFSEGITLIDGNELVKMARNIDADKLSLSLKKLEVSHPKLTPTQIESKVYEYIVDHGGEIDVERCVEELGVSESKVEKAIKSLEAKGKLEEE